MTEMKTIRYIFLVCSVLWTSVWGISAQSLNYSVVPVNAGWTAMAGTGVGVAGGDGIQWNRVAQVSMAEKTAGASISYGNWQPALSDKHPLSASVFYNLNQRFTFTLGTVAFNGSDITFQDDQGNPLETYRSKESVLGAGFGYRISSGLSVGLSVDYTSFQLGPDLSNSAIGFDLSAMYNSGNLSVGVLACDLASADLPGRGAVAVSYELVPAMNHRVEVQSETGFVFSTKSASLGLGFRYTSYDLISVSAGYYLGNKEEYIPSHVSLGTGIHFGGVSIDCAYLLFDSDRGKSWIATLSYSL